MWTSEWAGTSKVVVCFHCSPRARDRRPRSDVHRAFRPRESCPTSAAPGPARSAAPRPASESARACSRRARSRVRRSRHRQRLPATAQPRSSLDPALLPRCPPAQANKSIRAAQAGRYSRTGTASRASVPPIRDQPQSRMRRPGAVSRSRRFREVAEWWPGRLARISPSGGSTSRKRALGTIRTRPAAATPAARTIATGVLLGIEPTYAKKEADEDEASEQRQPEHRQGLDRKDSKDRGDRTHIPEGTPLGPPRNPDGDAACSPPRRR